MKENDWLLPIKVPKQAKRLLLTFHYAASSATIFYPWKEFLDEDTILYAIELPGRGTRYEEEPVSDLREIVLKIAESITPYLGKIPITIFGHSMGGILGFEIASILLTENKYLIEQLIMSAVTPPGYKQISSPIHDLDDEMFKKELTKYGGLPKTLQNNIDFWKIYLPIARADFKMLANYVPKESNSVLPCDITALIGKEDKIVTRDKAKHWCKFTNAKFNLIEIDGGHLFIKDTKTIIKIINAILLKDYRNLASLSPLIHREVIYAI